MNMIGKNPDDDLDAYKDKHYFTYAILRNTLEELWAEGTIHSTPTVVQFTNTTLKSKMDFQSGIMRIEKNFLACLRHLLIPMWALLTANDDEALSLVKQISVTNENYC